MASNATDTARPTFYTDAIQNMKRSNDEGRPIFDDKEMIRIDIPGDKNLNWIGEVEEKHRERWPDHYARFKRNEQRAVSGTPIEQWPNANLTKSRVAEIKASNILSVEELSMIPDSSLGKLGMGGRELREQARAWLTQAANGAKDAALAKENAELRERLERLEAMMSPKPVEPKEKSIDDCSDDELKIFIERETGEKQRSNAARDKLLARARELAEQKQAA